MAQIPVLSARGANIPALGFGTSQLGDCGEIVATALKIGYRHIDTAWKYGSETGVGEGIRTSRVPREEIFLCTKVSHEYLRAADFARSVDESLRNLQVDYVDLLHVHWPTVDNIPLAETMGALAKAKRDGLTRHIGVANFNIALLEDPYVTVDALAPFAFSVHLKDMAVQPSERGFLLSEVPCGTGFLDLPRIVATLRKANRDIAFNLEMATRDPKAGCHALRANMAPVSGSISVVTKGAEAARDGPRTHSA